MMICDRKHGTGKVNSSSFEGKSVNSWEGVAFCYDGMKFIYDRLANYRCLYLGLIYTLYLIIFNYNCIVFNYICIHVLLIIIVLYLII